MGPTLLAVAPPRPVGDILNAEGATYRLLAKMAGLNGQLIEHQVVFTSKTTSKFNTDSLPIKILYILLILTLDLGIKTILFMLFPRLDLPLVWSANLPGVGSSDSNREQGQLYWRTCHCGTTTFRPRLAFLNACTDQQVNN